MEATIACPADMIREALAHHKAGRFLEAAAIYELVLQTDPRHADAHHLLGLVAHQRGEHQTAVDRIEQAIGLNPNLAVYHSNRGVALRALRRPADAIAALRRAAELDGASADIALNLGNAHIDLGEYEDAAAAFRRSVDLDPRKPQAWTGLGEALRIKRDLDESRRCHERALALAPQLPEAHHNIGLTERDRGDSAEAIACLLRAVSLRPDFIEAHVALANLYEDIHDFARAQAGYDRALRVAPDFTAARFNRALALLRQGELAAGWDAYESRWRHNNKPRVFSQPIWDGSLARDKTVLIYSEQGIGDEVMFASCIPEVIERAGACLIECEQRLLRLFARSFPKARCFPRTALTDPSLLQNLPDFDLQTASGSIPRWLRRSFDTFPTHPGYLVPDADQVAEWRKRYEQLGAGLVVGISWKGGTDAGTRRRRSTLLGKWAPLFRLPGVAFVNLQYGDCRAEIAKFEREYGVKLHHFDDSNPLADLDRFAAQIAGLDLVISVDNSTVHMAGALNTPLWTLLPYSCDWRWFTERDESPWYPSMRLFRQASFREMARSNWDEVFARVSRALEELIAERAADLSRRATRLQKERRLAEAIQCFSSAAALRPRDAETLNNLGIAWKEGGRLDLAVAAYRRAIDARPDFAIPWFNCGNTHREDNRLIEAADCYEEARRHAPGNAQILVNLAVTLKHLRRLDDAAACLNDVLGRSPDLPAARFDRSLMLLLRGELGPGWDEYEWRLRQEPVPAPCGIDRWDGTALHGRSILVLSEQGIGDEVMFGSCLPQLAREARRCVFQCDPRLVPLVSRSLPGITVIPKTTDAKAISGTACEVHEFLGSLPRRFRRTLSDFPREAGYLRPDPGRVAEWRSKFARLGSTLKVGISWRGGKDRETQRQRSIPVEQWSLIVQVPGVRFVNLQYGPAAAEAAHFRERFGIALDDGADCDPVADLDDFAAKLAALDLVISVDNSTVHLAGALGRPVWTLLPFCSDWRWLLESETTPWYPTMRLLRSRALESWSELMLRTARFLTEATFNVKR
jgi:tetratricopeptide (TPR) repeat protein